MDLTPYLPWLRLVHVVAAFLFVAGHGVSMFVVFQVRKETDPKRMLALLDLSGNSLTLAGLGLLVLFVGGIVSGIVGGYFGHAWIWVAIVLLFAITGLMTPTAGAYLSGLRLALGQRTRNVKAGEPDPVPLPMADVLALAQSRRPEAAALIGGIGFLVILWLMMFKPF